MEILPEEVGTIVSLKEPHYKPVRIYKTIVTLTRDIEMGVVLLVSVQELCQGIIEVKVQGQGMGNQIIQMIPDILEIEQIEKEAHRDQIRVKVFQMIRGQCHL
jgi:hypothetical protein